MGARISTVNTWRPPADPDSDTRKKLGDWLSRTKNTIYQAATDGLVCVVYPVDAGAEGLTDVSTPPTIRRVNSTNDTGDDSITFPVKKNDYWKAVGGSIQSVWWIPFEVDVIE